MYDDAGRLEQVLDWIDGVNGIQYAYDELNRLEQVMAYDGSSLLYSYDAAGNVATMTDYHGSVTSYTYTDRNELDRLTAPGSKVWDFDYNANGQPTQYTHPNGMMTRYAYDTLNRLETIDHLYATNPDDIAQSFDYTYDKVGNIMTATHADGSHWDLGYDGRYRLSSATCLLRLGDAQGIFNRFLGLASPCE